MDSWHIVFYDDVSLINKLHFFNIDVYGFKKIDDYKYYFEAGRKNRRLIKKNFKDCKLVRVKGFLNYFEVMITKMTFVCILIAGFSLFNVSKRIWRIEINGDYKEVEQLLEEELNKYDLKISKYYPNESKLKEIEGNIALYLSKEIEFLELRRKGAVIALRYQKRRSVAPLPEKKTNLYATKDGMIKYFNIQSGVKQVKEYDYVRKGDLLVSDVVETSSGDLINVGTLGSVFANTFYVINVEIEGGCTDEAAIFSNMLDKAKRKISENISKYEKIEIERILDYSINEGKGKMKVYYMLLEDITI